ncbi:pentapeptide repeat-containing protein [Nocardia sp. NPDC046763]|uniref:pentapeptide repeat-containing protein n=1 Tax=Nocardia sp. NPDC046763 TaxID=3155256 RepID=UPI0033C749E4
MTTLATAAGTLLAAGAATGALWFTGQSLRATNAQLGMSQQTAVTDRFRLAAEQLASDKINIKLSGIYLLERLAKDSPPDHATVYAVLAAFVRTQAPVTSCDTQQAAPIDIQAALTAIGDQDTQAWLEGKTDLNRTCLASADLVRADLNHADLFGANLFGADLTNANLTKANLTDAKLEYTSLPFTGLAYTSLVRANLSNAYLTNADLTKADLFGANLTDANLEYANLTDANLTDANLNHANLTGANLNHANLTGANLTGIEYGERTQWPRGFTPPPSR